MLAHLKSLIESRFPRLFGLLADIRDSRALKDGEPEMRLLPRLVARGETVCDIGANRGLYTYWLLRLGARIFAFEPNPRLVRVMQLRFGRAIAGGRLTVDGCALSDTVGEIVLHVPVDAAALGTVEAAAFAKLGDAPMESFTVRKRRLDDVVRDKVDFMKIDVEGHEIAVIDGGLGIIARDLPTLLIEAEERHRPGAVASLRQRLEPLGYKGYYLDCTGLRPIETFDPAVHQDVGALNEAGTHRLEGRIYYNNFIFVARAQARAKLTDLIGADR